jgi:hypothetical protein
VKNNVRYFLDKSAKVSSPQAQQELDLNKDAAWPTKREK